MTNIDNRIADDMAAEVLAEAARLYAQASKSYSFADLQQACAQANIPSHIVTQAIKNIEEKRARERYQRQQQREYINKQVKKGISGGIKLLIPAIAVSSIFIFRAQFEPVVTGLIYAINPNWVQTNSSVKIKRVKQGKLEYLNDMKGLSIAITDAGRYGDVSFRGVISTDGYKSLPISGNVGSVFEYKGIYNYRIKAVEVEYNSVTFQIEQLSNKSESVRSSFDEEVKQLIEQREKLQKQVKTLQVEKQYNEKILQNKYEEIERF
ncbi:MAG: hypothetical protein IGS39_21065 [Calothrix sp. C42_A2020_038]|nr:hypothetical protein [Calothrix sp. C42_A2020_038]